MISADPVLLERAATRNHRCISDSNRIDSWLPFSLEEIWHYINIFSILNRMSGLSCQGKWTPVDTDDSKQEDRGSDENKAGQLDCWRTWEMGTATGYVKPWNHTAFRQLETGKVPISECSHDVSRQTGSALGNALSAREKAYPCNNTERKYCGNYCITLTIVVTITCDQKNIAHWLQVFVSKCSPLSRCSWLHHHAYRVISN